MSPSPLAVVVTITLWASLVGLGTTTSPALLVAPLRRGSALLRIVAFDALVVPPLAWLAVTVFGVPHGAAVGLLLVGAASAGPLGIVATRIARGDGALAVAAVGILELANLVVIPAWSAILLPETVTVPLVEIVMTVVLLIALPLLLGTLIGARLPRVVPSLTRILSSVATIGWLLAVTLALAGSWGALGNRATSGVAGASLALMAACLVGGWLVAGDPAERRAAGALVTAQRGNIVALGIASTAFAGIPEAALVVSVFGAVVSLIVPATAFLFRWRHGAMGASSTVEASA